jgi:hypothetical protein
MSLPKVNIYTYTAQANPYFARSLAHKFGYEFDKDQPLSSVLQQLVSYEGEAALNEIIENNPDKDLFMDYFKKKFQNEEQKQSNLWSTVGNPITQQEYFEKAKNNNS